MKWGPNLAYKEKERIFTQMSPSMTTPNKFSLLYLFLYIWCTYAAAGVHLHAQQNNLKKSEIHDIFKYEKTWGGSQNDSGVHKRRPMNGSSSKIRPKSTGIC
jgi:hypothetical protein